MHAGKNWQKREIALKEYRNCIKIFSLKQFGEKVSDVYRTVKTRSN